MEETSKICSKCRFVKKLSQFYKDKGKPDGLHTSCKQCNDKNVKRSYIPRPENILDWDERVKRIKEVDDS